MLIGQQLVQATGEEYLYEQTEISVQCKEHEFTAKGKLPVQMGFKEAEEAFRKYCVKDKNLMNRIIRQNFQKDMRKE